MVFPPQVFPSAPLGAMEVFVRAPFGLFARNTVVVVVFATWDR
jgi:hypothetical protein